ncbi:MAG TPA: pilus assembly protein TadG-related protein [Mycobacteriales bacterium]|nr:pilus assembly protein TadG-related protein [Mycobacteriales bacterium]
MTGRGAADSGVLSPFAALCAVALLLCTGLAVDGAAKLRAAGRAQQVAAEAARAAAQAVDTRGPVLRIDPAAAARAARAYLHAAGLQGTVTVTADRTVQVTTDVTGTYLILGPLTGHTGYTVTGQATATAAVGVTRAGP